MSSHVASCRLSGSYDSSQSSHPCLSIVTLRIRWRFCYWYQRPTNSSIKRLFLRVFSMVEGSNDNNNNVFGFKEISIILMLKLVYDEMIKNCVVIKRYLWRVGIWNSMVLLWHWSPPHLIVYAHNCANKRVTLLVSSPSIYSDDKYLFKIMGQNVLLCVRGRLIGELSVILCV